MTIALCLPILNAESEAKIFLEALAKQSQHVDELLVVDSDSTDKSVSLFLNYGARVHKIARSDFNHGYTRQLAVELCSDADIIIFMTQDAVLASCVSVEKIIACFKDQTVGAVCGRQLPHVTASPIAAHARIFNYPSASYVSSQVNFDQKGIKCAFISNSFAAYRRAAIMSVGGFPNDVIFGEDTYVATKMLLNGWKVAYSAEATVYHSHNYSFKQEFHRYFDIGVFHSREPWFLEALGQPEGEGKRFVLSELKYLIRHAPLLIPSACIRTCLKFIGYKLGKQEKNLPSWLKLKLSMFKGYWKET